MEYQDLRDWIQIAEEMGELKTLKGCDWNLEIGAITDPGAPTRRGRPDDGAVLEDDLSGVALGLQRQRPRDALTAELHAQFGDRDGFQ